MHRLWFKVWLQGQAIAPPIQVASLPRGVQVSGNIAVRRSRSHALVAVYALAADAEQAQQILKEAQELLPEFRPLPQAPASECRWAVSQGEVSHARKRPHAWTRAQLLFGLGIQPKQRDQEKCPHGAVGQNWQTCWTVERKPDDRPN